MTHPHRLLRWLAASALIPITLAACGDDTTGSPGADVAGQDTLVSGADGGATDVTSDDGAGPTLGDGTIVLRDLSGAAIAPDGNVTAIGLDGVPPFSMGTLDLSVDNLSASALVINGVRLEPIGETDPYEWALNEPGRTDRLPLEIDHVSVAPGESLSFGLYFEPLASGPRDVRVVIDYGDDGATYAVVVNARGRDNATFSPDLSVAWQRLFGRSNTEASSSAQPGSIRLNAAGETFVNLNVSQWEDDFNPNLAVAKIGADGTLAWVRELDEDYDQECRDIGDTGEYGGAQDSLVIGSDGDLYLAAQRSLSATAAFQAFVTRLDSGDGAPVWATGVTLGADESPARASEALRAGAIDASLSDRVLIGGQVADSQGALFAALDKSDGALRWAFSLNFGGTHRVSSLAVDPAADQAWFAGVAGNAPFVARIDGVSGATPTLGWAHRYSPGFANIHAMVRDGDGLLVALDVRGATTHFVGARLSSADGSVVWSKVWNAANAGDNDNTLAVALVDGQVVFGGRIAFAPFDTQGGDGFLLSLDAATGAYTWGAFLYTGKGAEEMTGTAITALAPTSNGLWLVAQQTPGSHDTKHFWGRWYQATDDTLELPGGDGHERLADFAFALDDGGEPTWQALDAAQAHPQADKDTLWIDTTSSLVEPVQGELDDFNLGVHTLIQHIDFK